MSTDQSILPNQLNQLVSLTSILLSAQNEDELLQNVVDALVNTFGYDVAYFRMLAADHYLEMRAHAGTQSDFLHNPKKRRMAPGAGINGRAILTGEIIAISDVRNDDAYHFPEVRERENLVGMLAAPMYSVQKTIGVLSCYTRIPHEFTEEEKHIVSALAKMTAVVLSKIHYFEELQFLDDFGQELTQKSDLKDVLETIVVHARKLAKADGARLFPYDSEKKRFVLNLGVGTGIGQREELARRHRPNPQGIASQVIERGMIRLEGEEISHSPLLSQEVRKVLSTEGIQAFAGLVLKTEVPVGVLYLNYKNPTDLPRPEELQEKFDKFLRHAALAIERAWLFEYRQQEQQLLEFASNVTSEVRNARNVWQKFLTYAMDRTNATSANISVVSKDGLYLERLVQHGFPELSDHVHDIGGSSIQGQAAKHKHSILIRNVLTDEVWKDTYCRGLPNTLSELVVPVLDSGPGGEQVIAVFNLEHYEESAFDDHDLRLIELLALHAKIALKIAENYERLERESARLESLQKAARAITSSRRQNVLETILQEAVNLTGANFATIQKRVGDHIQFQEILPAEQWDMRHNLIPDGLLRLDGPGITVMVANERRPILENDVRSNPNYWDGNNGQTLSELAVPMLKDNEILWGVLNVEKQVKGGFTLGDQKTLSALADLAIAAIQSDEHYSNMQSDKNVEAISHALSYVVQVHRLNNEIGLMPAEADAALEELQKTPLSSDLQETLQKHLETIIEKGHQITEGISKVYRTFNGRPQPVNLSAVCKEAKNNINIPANVSISLHLDSNTPEVLASKEMLVGILENMFQNSIKQLRKGGQIWVESEISDPNWIDLQISDNGEGIPSRKLRDLAQFSFDHNQEQRVTYQKNKGMGLGLPLANSYVRKIGGELQIESRVTEGNHGTCIKLKLPLLTEWQWNRLGPLMSSYES